MVVRYYNVRSLRRDFTFDGCQITGLRLPLPPRLLQNPLVRRGVIWHTEAARAHPHIG